MTLFEIILVFVLVVGILPFFVLSYVIYSTLLVRTKPEKWDHGCSLPEDEELVRVYTAGVAWREEHKDVLTPAEVCSEDGLRLYGEYFDFGSDRAVILLPGRMESCHYTCYFAEPYRRAGWNVLVVDGRAHGFSEGKINYIGYRECRDMLVWGRWLHEQKNNASVLLHGVCIGACTSIFAMTQPDTPDYFRGLVVEGMYCNFFHSMKNHMKANGRPLFPFLYIVTAYIRLISGVNIVGDGPEKRIRVLKKPILMLHGEQDRYSLPEKAVEMYESCAAPKRLVWFEKGSHSRLRINNTDEYDQAIFDFLPMLEAAADEDENTVAVR